MVERDWYEAIVISNSILGSSFPIGEICVFRKKSARRFEIFNLIDTVKILSGTEAKEQLRSSRDSRTDALLRARDQGYINWKYESI